MKGVNEVILMGNLARDPELRTTTTGKNVTTMTVATNRGVKQQDGSYRDEADFNRVVAWGNTATNCQRYLSKGSPVLIQGRLSTRDYEDKSGVKRYITEVIARSVIFLPNPKGQKEPDPIETDDFPMDISENIENSEDADIPF